jgi:hypothetical protein
MIVVNSVVEEEMVNVSDVLDTADVVEDTVSVCVVVLVVVVAVFVIEVDWETVVVVLEMVEAVLETEAVVELMECEMVLKAELGAVEVETDAA